RHVSRYVRHHRRCCAPSNLWRHLVGVKLYTAIKFSIVVCSNFAPVLFCFLESFTFRRVLSAFNESKRCLVWRNQTCPGSDFACANTESQSSKGAMRRRVTVAAYDGQTGQRQS